MMAPWRRSTPRPRPPSQPPRGSGFNITRLDPEPIAQPEPIASVPDPENLLAARFTSAAEALSFMVAVKGETRRQPSVHRAPDGAIWAVVHQPRPADVELAWAVGGSVHLPDGPDVVSPRGNRTRWVDLQAWPAVSWIELSAGVPVGAAVTDQPEIVVVTTGSLARWIIERSQAANLDLRLATARLSAVFRSSVPDWSAVLIRITGPGRPVPRAFSQALAGLPYTVVCRRTGAHLLVDQRLDLPLPDEELGRWVPTGQEWLLTGEFGVWRFAERGAEFRPPLHAGSALQPPPVAPPGRLPSDLGVTVALVPDDRPRTIDALLLSDDELVPLRRFLTGQPQGERAFLILGPGHHLLADPGRSVAEIPFGIPLHRIGPGALYQEVGYRLRPALPAAARATLFKLDETSLVVVRSGQADRLSLRNIVPIWSLWLEPADAAVPGVEPLSTRAREILSQVDAANARASGRIWLLLSRPGTMPTSAARASCLSSRASLPRRRAGTGKPVNRLRPHDCTNWPPRPTREHHRRHGHAARARMPLCPVVTRWDRRVHRGPGPGRAPGHIERPARLVEALGRPAGVSR